MRNIGIFLTMICLTLFAFIKEVNSTVVLFDGMASWYSENDPEILKTTANMERFSDEKLTCAMWGLAFNTILKVTNTGNGKSVFVRINDRGPAKRLVQKGRIVDLTKSAFAKIADLEKGLIHVKIEIM